MPLGMRVVNASVFEPLYEYNDRRYMRFVLGESDAATIRARQDAKKHLVQGHRVDDPLDGRVLMVKVPWRYKRPMCKVDGLTPISCLKKGDVVELDIEFTGVWNVNGYSGYTWKLNALKSDV
ncbi:hypothetical protein DSLPV1_025 [Dishui lake phycodnavirus 1]|uniref:hypothetical protein n=1 Tax=Dishui lake phycodnavirus 1 TaxID=2079134 RepID=UPI000CD6B585|nr:hypothetical protein C5Y57_gp025 [Dishui lake phycodnavirus 1]AUT18996.1 hypothetical protein DSLPV1_025 [Dishui lake phycodnavirus 1]